MQDARSLQKFVAHWLTVEREMGLYLCLRRSRGMTTRCLFALLVLLARVPLAYSKGSPNLILVSGGVLAKRLRSPTLCP
jgi:hypothetical protein